MSKTKNEPDFFEIGKMVVTQYAEMIRRGHVICRYCNLPYPVQPDDPEITENRKPLCDSCVEEIKKTR